MGGAQQNTLFTVSHLDASRFRAVLITGEPGMLDQDAKALPGVDVYQVPTMVRPLRPWRDLRALVFLTVLLRTLKPAIVHTHSSKAGVLGRLAAWFAGVPIIIHAIHGFGFTRYQHPLLRYLLLSVERIVARITTRFFAVSEANCRQGVTLGLFPADRCTVIRSGIDLAAFRQIRVDVPQKKRELGLEPTRPVVGMIAPFKPQKAPVDFVRMADLVHRIRPDVRFLLVGDGELRKAVEAEREERGLSTVLRLAGWRRDIPGIMRCLDVLVLTSLWEGLPRVYLEALASGVPVVGTRVDGAAEVVREGFTGFLTEPGDVLALAERVLHVLAHPEEAKRMGLNGQALPLEFDIHEMVRQQEREYDTLLATLPRKREYGVTCKFPYSI
jgi:glycosyltransferase involved in cell wall biosynthesis